jgi:ankyrin repeat protein
MIDPELAKTRILGDNRLLGVTYEHGNPMQPTAHGQGRSSTPLHHAAVRSLTEIARELLDAGANPNAWGYDNNHGVCTPVVLASWEGDIEILKLLLERAADPNLRSSKGQSALMTALEHRKFAHVEALLTAGASPGIHEAAALGRTDDLTRFLDREPELLESSDGYRQATPLYFAACLDQAKVIELLVGRGANKEARHGGGWTPLLAAGYFKAYGAIRSLIELGANVKAADQNGYWGVPAESTILHMLCDDAAAPLTLLSLALQSGADPGARRADGLTPIEVAVRKGIEPAAEILNTPDRSHGS